MSERHGMTGENDNSTHGRYQQVLAWRAEGLTHAEIGRRLGVSEQRAGDLARQARRWQQRTRVASSSTPSQSTVSAQTPLQALPIPAQAKEVLWRIDVQTVGEVAAMSDAALLRLSGIGRTTVATLRAYLAQHSRPAATPDRETHL